MIERVTSLVGTRNMPAEVFIIIWELTEHRGHLVLMTIKLSINYKALDDRNNSLHSTVPGQDKERTGVTVGA